MLAMCGPAPNWVKVRVCVNWPAWICNDFSALTALAKAAVSKRASFANFVPHLHQSCASPSSVSVANFVPTFISLVPHLHQYHSLILCPFSSVLCLTFFSISRLFCAHLHQSCASSSSLAYFVSTFISLVPHLRCQKREAQAYTYIFIYNAFYV
jgi:hypothetical protein